MHNQSMEAKVKVKSMALLSPHRPDILLPVPEDGKPEGVFFTVKGGGRCHMRFTFQVCCNSVSGLKYTNDVYKAGIRVYSRKETIGSFSPAAEAYVYDVPEETTPSSVWIRGSYSSKIKFVDDNNKCYFEIDFTFEIRKEGAG